MEEEEERRGGSDLHYGREDGSKWQLQGVHSLRSPQTHTNEEDGTSQQQHIRSLHPREVGREGRGVRDMGHG